MDLEVERVNPPTVLLLQILNINIIPGFIVLPQQNDTLSQHLHSVHVSQLIPGHPNHSAFHDVSN